ncbi:hypothetical protein PTSG_03782 [Salpingoeca rosetta]|uniref:Uncharacterized protein n=1 Tax=Salpingoeca rosetta (strain ATCC 50818 / BSB-021) TaxID=946362 RepID=F2U5D4_SALR5|nr:uncharacterized protein PTSG_03782 [Salpingoeca rosetta]EGD83150.1 hypothetical protein PTSG_03782 [Salpingoeca rosetta]|eukprot:XP_004995514.1 hypothetical protein PTSG_03782 [Salpingoeca rosetta]
MGKGGVAEGVVPPGQKVVEEEQEEEQRQRSSSRHASVLEGTGQADVGSASCGSWGSSLSAVEEELAALRHRHAQLLAEKEAVDGMLDDADDELETTQSRLTHLEKTCRQQAAELRAEREALMLLRQDYEAMQADLDQSRHHQHQQLRRSRHDSTGDGCLDMAQLDEVNLQMRNAGTLEGDEQSTSSPVRAEVQLDDAGVRASLASILPADMAARLLQAEDAQTQLLTLVEQLQLSLSAQQRDNDDPSQRRPQPENSVLATTHGTTATWQEEQAEAEQAEAEQAEAEEEAEEGSEGKREGQARNTADAADDEPPQGAGVDDSLAGTQHPTSGADSDVDVEDTTSCHELSLAEELCQADEHLANESTVGPPARAGDEEDVLKTGTLNSCREPALSHLSRSVDGNATGGFGEYDATRACDEEDCSRTWDEHIGQQRLDADEGEHGVDGEDDDEFFDCKAEMIVTVEDDINSTVSATAAGTHTSNAGANANHGVENTSCTGPATGVCGGEQRTPDSSCDLDDADGGGDDGGGRVVQAVMSEDAVRAILSHGPQPVPELQRQLIEDSGLASKYRSQAQHQLRHVLAEMEAKDTLVFTVQGTALLAVLR